MSQHSLTHKPAPTTCINRGGRTRKPCAELFASYSAMLQHIEQGACNSGQLTTRDLAAAMIYDVPGDQGCVSAWARDAVHPHSTLKTPYDKLWFCRGCRREFRLLSDLFEHMELRSCPQRLQDGHVRILQDTLAARGLRR
ncbi:hypothetical protein MBLNU459_g0220t2 [Dothideomycetes sp. NU459]